MIQVKLYDCIPTRNIDIDALRLGWRAFTKVQVTKGTKLYEMKYSLGTVSFDVVYYAPCDGFYVHNTQCIEHAKLFNWGHLKIEPILCEFWESKEEYELKSKDSPRLPQYKDIYKNSVEPNTKKTIKIKEITKPSEEPCYTYIMHNLDNNRYKIGMSKYPKVRERTLQSAEPNVELIYTQKHANRRLARQREKYLHNLFRHYKYRGEWYTLSSRELDEIMTNSI